MGWSSRSVGVDFKTKNMGDSPVEHEGFEFPDLGWYRLMFVKYVSVRC